MGKTWARRSKNSKWAKRRVRSVRTHVLPAKVVAAPTCPKHPGEPMTEWLITKEPLCLKCDPVAASPCLICTAPRYRCSC